MSRLAGSSLGLILFVAGLAGCSDNHKERVTLHDLPGDQKAAAHPAPAPERPPECPKGGVTPLPPSPNGLGHHRVFLNWHASAPAPDPENNPVGYCVYRSQNGSELKRDPTCQLCEGVNPHPLAGTACVDNQVADGGIYFYVATAVSRHEILSPETNEVTVRIPRTKDKLRPDPPGFYPPCRGIAP